MTGSNFQDVVELIRKEDGRYEAGAYEFLRKGLDFTLERIRKSEGAGKTRHITGQELSMGLKDYALQQYGPMAWTLLQAWGIGRTEDFGEIVFNLVEYGVFGKTDSDRREDFDKVYDLKEALTEPFEPKAVRQAKERARRKETFAGNERS